MIELSQTLEDESTMEHLKTHIGIISAAYLFSIHSDATVADLAKMLNISERTLYRWAKKETWDQALDTLDFRGNRSLRKQKARNVSRENKKFEEARTIYMRLVIKGKSPGEAAFAAAAATGITRKRILEWSHRYEWGS